MQIVNSLFVLLLVPAVVLATTFKYGSFCDLNQLSVNGNTRKEGGSLHLTTSRGDQTGSVFLEDPVDITQSWSATFKFVINNQKNAGSDGMAFVMQSNYPTIVGSDGSQIGYGQLHNTIAVELDTWYNQDLNDPNDNHASLHFPSSVSAVVEAAEGPNHPNARSVTSFELTDGQEHTAFLAYNANSHTLQLTLDHEQLSPWTVDLSTVIANPTAAFVGFSAATGGADYETHTITYWDMKLDAMGNNCINNEFDQSKDCAVKPSNGQCGNYGSCGECSSAYLCCGWCSDSNACFADTNTAGCGLQFTCPSPSSHSVVWWGIGIVIAVLILCVLALFVYWRRTRVKSRPVHPTLLDVTSSDSNAQSAESEYAKL